MKMIKPLVIALLIFFTNKNAISQVKKTAYKSSSYKEMMWSYAKDEYITIETVYKPSQFVFTEKEIYFKKGDKDWLYNSWTFDKSESVSDDYSIDTYYDDRGQKIVIYYKTSEIWYFHDKEENDNRYKYVTMYKNCKEDKELIGDAEKSRTNATTSEKFRLDFNMVSVYDADTKKWSEWKEGLNTFVINVNSNGDITHVTANGKEKLYRRTSKKVERDYTKDGSGYQIINAIDYDGNNFRFQVFDDEKIGIKMIYGNVMIQFSK